jgi:3-hydroxyisobutyrate dehydrogenase-like beta-hydroxyacid dehydrogenase
MMFERPWAQKQMKIGVIGFANCCEMGRPIAANLLRAGHVVVVYDRTLARAASLEASGGPRGTKG